MTPAYPEMDWPAMDEAELSAEMRRIVEAEAMARDEAAMINALARRPDWAMIATKAGLVAFTVAFWAAVGVAIWRAFG